MWCWERLLKSTLHPTTCVRIPLEEARLHYTRNTRSPRVICQRVWFPGKSTATDRGIQVCYFNQTLKGFRRRCFIYLDKTSVLVAYNLPISKGWDLTPCWYGCHWFPQCVLFQERAECAWPEHTEGGIGWFPRILGHLQKRKLVGLTQEKTESTILWKDSSSTYPE